MNAYYNEHDPRAAEWLRQLIADGLITPGVVDERSIELVQPGDLTGFDRCHFFAGIGGWDYALQLAGWATEPVWTGSCPCQPFSDAGKGEGFDDERHLWPAWLRLIRECRPPAIFGEQVASRAGLGWLDLVSTDLEAEGYAFGAADLAAASVGAPHRRQRLFFVADAQGRGASAGEQRRRLRGAEQGRDAGALADSGHLAGSAGHRATGSEARGACGEAREQRLRADAGAGGAGSLADHDRQRRALGPQPDGAALESGERAPRRADADGRGEPGALADSDGRQHRRQRSQRIGQHGLLSVGGGSGRLVDAACERRREGRPESAREQGRLDASEPSDAVGQADSIGERPQGQQRERSAQGPTERGGRNPWADLEWIPCRDGKLRPTQPGLSPLASGIPGRVGLIRGYGNAIVPQVAAAFVRACAAQAVESVA